MHKSKLAGLVIDCQASHVRDAANFWHGVLGGELDIDEDGKYAAISDQGDIQVLVQAVDHPARVHLDIASDDKDAEVTRLEGLGAKKVVTIKSWIVMEAPTGHRFCVVNPQTDNFDQTANRWE